MRFRDSGETYVYYMVERRVYEELMSAESMGAYLNQQVKGRYPYEKVESS